MFQPTKDFHGSQAGAPSVAAPPSAAGGDDVESEEEEESAVPLGPQKSHRIRRCDAALLLFLKPSAASRLPELAPQYSAHMINARHACCAHCPGLNASPPRFPPKTLDRPLFAHPISHVRSCVSGVQGFMSQVFELLLPPPPPPVSKLSRKERTHKKIANLARISPLRHPSPPNSPAARAHSSANLTERRPPTSSSDRRRRCASSSTSRVSTSKK